ncbi:MAG: hypothetical protein BGP06_09885 [Rhizobiales bacterium 65-9]|nr:MAG: hypothetical protein BGP06_09885 [Rhizobiales bacterium 65-9]
MGSRLFAIRRQYHRAAAFEIADDRSVSLASPKCEVINADNDELIMLLCNPQAHNAQQGIIAHRHHETFGEG